MSTKGGAKMPKLLADYIEEDEFAADIGVSVRTLQIWRKRRQGPPWTKIGGRVVYRHSACEDWLRANERKPVQAAV
jgi:hypothetical protein